jgi:hypothetical protein
MKAVDTFEFGIALPPEPDSLHLFEELSRQMSRYIGLDEQAAASAGAVLNRLVAERLDAGGAVEVTFSRPFVSASVNVEVSGPALPGDENLAAATGAEVTAETDGTRSRLRLAWDVPND